MREGTVKVHVRQIMRKFGVTNRTALAVAFVNGVLQRAALSLAAILMLVFPGWDRFTFAHISTGTAPIMNLILMK
jgi:hypothetical protein